MAGPRDPHLQADELSDEPLLALGPIGLSLRHCVLAAMLGLIVLAALDLAGIT